jgi:hypothetical protein
MITISFFSLAIFAMKHGDERLETAGPRKGQPERYNAFMKFLAVLVTYFILIAGGFFA